MKALLSAIAMAAAPLGLAHGEKSDGAKGIDYATAEEHPFGRAADPEKAKRTVRVQMTDHRSSRSGMALCRASICRPQ